MPVLTIDAAAPLVAGVHLTGPTREVTAVDVGNGLVEVELATLDVGARLVASPEVLANLLQDAVDTLARLRGVL